MRRGRCVRCGKTTKETKAGLRTCDACFYKELSAYAERMKKWWSPVPEVEDAYVVEPVEYL
jgi:hypothetical protein